MNSVKLLAASPDQLKHISSILQQMTTLTTAHVKASHSLAHFEMEAGNAERGIYIDEEHETKIRQCLVESVELAASNIKMIGDLV